MRTVYVSRAVSRARRRWRIASVGQCEVGAAYERSGNSRQCSSVIESVSGTIPYSFDAVDTAVDETVAVLAAGEQSLEVPIRFTEGRCDPHALAEVKQPHEFLLQVDLGDGVLLPHVVRPDPADFGPMRRTADAACVATGQVEFVGD